MKKTLIAITTLFVFASPVFAKPDAKQKIRDEIKQLSITTTEVERRPEQTEALLKRAYDLAATNFGKESPEMVWPEFARGIFLMNNRNATEGRAHFQHAYSLAAKFPANPCMRADYIEIWLFKADIRSGKVKEATELIANTLSKLEKAGKYKEIQDYAMQYARGGHCAEAIKTMNRAESACVKSGDDSMPVLQQQITILLRCRKFADAIPYIERKTNLLKQKGDMVRYADSERELAKMNDLGEHYEEAAVHFQKALQIFKMQKRDKYETAKLMDDYSRTLASLHRTKEAEALKRDAEVLKFGNPPK